MPRLKEMKPRLDESHIYLGDNGRCFCGSLRCAGMTAYYTGRDLSGQTVMRIPPSTDIPFKCETCGKTNR